MIRMLNIWFGAVVESTTRDAGDLRVMKVSISIYICRSQASKRCSCCFFSTRLFLRPIYMRFTVRAADVRIAGYFCGFSYKLLSGKAAAAI